MKKRRKIEVEKKYKPLLDYFSKPTNSQNRTKKTKGFDFEDYIYRIVVECNGEKHQKKLLKELESRGLKCRLLIS